MVGRRLIGISEMEGLLNALPAHPGANGRLFLVGDSTQLLEGWLPSVTTLVFATDPGGQEDAVTAAVTQEAAERELSVGFESPADVIPLPEGFEARHLPTRFGWDTDAGRLAVLHYDPYSVICRGLVRGDEPDYHTARRYLRHGWVTVDRMTELYDALLSRFTDVTIAQDPAEFRRKLKGLLQMWGSEGR